MVELWCILVVIAIIWTIAVGVYFMRHGLASLAKQMTQLDFRGLAGKQPRFQRLRLEDADSRFSQGPEGLMADDAHATRAGNQDLESSCPEPMNRPAALAPLAPRE
eukprot:TRINITY_DN13471_c0_g1_i1.p1 TRINITY_DN13471_c0_g1~~TRINITY_DN13471_c0_g1_i1.p1  ORF type:complete len:106 (+),score=7.45 TRINITY_DN13471_c0_g1_i1:124-441(+)